MSLLPRLDEIIPTGEQHHSCSYTIQAVMNNIGYINYFEAECVSMPMIKVCPKCGKYRNIGRIPVPVNNATIRKYGIDIENNIKVQTKQIINLRFISSPNNELLDISGTIQVLTCINFVSENFIKNANSQKENINTETLNEISRNWEDYSNIDYEFVGYDLNGNPKYLYEEFADTGDNSVQLTYTKIIIN